MPEYRRQTYAALPLKELAAALRADWRAYWEAPPDSWERDDVFDALMDALAVCEDAGLTDLWRQARSEARERVRKERAP